MLPTEPTKMILATSGLNFLRINKSYQNPGTVQALESDQVAGDQRYEY